MANTAPFRLEVLRRMTALIETIGVSSAIAYADMSGKVKRGRIMFGEETPVPFVAILEPPIPVDQLPSPEGSDSTSGYWDLLIQGFVEDDEDNPTDPAHILCANVRAVLAQHREDEHLNGLFGMGVRTNVVEDIFIGEPKVRPSDEISAKAYFWLPIRLKVVETLTEPLNYKEV